MDPSGTQKGFAFIPVDGAGKPKTARDRKRVRSHAMQGKNLRIGVHPVPEANANAHQELCDEAKGLKMSRLPSPNRTALPPFRLGDTLDGCSPAHVLDGAYCYTSRVFFLFSFLRCRGMEMGKKSPRLQVEILGILVWGDVLCYAATLAPWDSGLCRQLLNTSSNHMQYG